MSQSREKEFQIANEVERDGVLDVDEPAINLSIDCQLNQIVGSVLGTLKRLKELLTDSCTILPFSDDSSNNLSAMLTTSGDPRVGWDGNELVTEVTKDVNE